MSSPPNRERRRMRPTALRAAGARRDRRAASAFRSPRAVAEAPKNRLRLAARSNQRQRRPLVQLVQQLRRRVEVGIGRRDLRVPHPGNRAHSTWHPSIDLKPSALICDRQAVVQEAAITPHPIWPFELLGEVCTVCNRRAVLPVRFNCSAISRRASFGDPQFPGDARMAWSGRWLVASTTSTSSSCFATLHGN